MIDVSMVAIEHAELNHENDMRYAIELEALTAIASAIDVLRELPNHSDVLRGSLKDADLLHELPEILHKFDMAIKLYKGKVLWADDVIALLHEWAHEKVEEKEA